MLEQFVFDDVANDVVTLEQLWHTEEVILFPCPSLTPDNHIYPGRHYPVCPSRDNLVRKRGFESHYPHLGHNCQPRPAPSSGEYSVKFSHTPHTSHELPSCWLNTEHEQWMFLCLLKYFKLTLISENCTDDWKLCSCWHSLQSFIETIQKMGLKIGNCYSTNAKENVIFLKPVRIQRFI